jgi:prolipoprotein diacylglyceryltransferase
MKSLKVLVTGMLIAASTAIYTPSSAQCSMCRAVAESGSKNDAKKTAAGLNTGILYLLSIPYVLGGVAFFIWRKNRKKPGADLTIN